MGGRQPAQEQVHADAGQGVERAERLVGQQQLRPPDQGPGQGDSLLFAARQFVRPGRLPLGQLHLRKGLPRPLARSGAVQAQDDVVQHPLPRQKARVLEHHRQPVRTDDLALSLRFVVQARQGAQQGALARAAAPEQGDEFALPNVEIDPVQYAPQGEAADEIADSDHGGAGIGGPEGGHRARVFRQESRRRSSKRTAASDDRPRTA